MIMDHKVLVNVPLILEVCMSLTLYENIRFFSPVLIFADSKSLAIMFLCEIGFPYVSMFVKDDFIVVVFLCFVKEDFIIISIMFTHHTCVRNLYFKLM